MKDALLITAAAAIKKKYGPNTRIVMQKEEDPIYTYPAWMFDAKERIDRWGYMLA